MQPSCRNSDCHLQDNCVYNEKRKQPFGWAYFSSPTYMVSAGAREVSCLVHFQRHHVTSDTGSKTVDKSCIEDNSKSLVEEQETEKPRKSLQNHSVETESVNARRTSTSKNSLTPTTDIFYVPFEVRPGSAQPGIHYEPISAGVLHFTGEEKEHSILIGLNVDNSVPVCSEPLDFYVILSSHHSNQLKREENADPEEEQNSPNRLRVATPASPSVARVLLLPSDASDCLEMQTSHYYATPDSTSVVVAVIRRGPCQQFCQVEIFTRDGTAGAAESNNENGDYLPLTKDIEFQPGVSSHLISIQLIHRKPNNRYFFAELRNPRGNCKLGEHKVAICYLNSVDGAADAQDVVEGDISWSDQFRMAITLIPSVDENGIQVPLTNMDYALHGVTFFWKLLSAFLPPSRVTVKKRKAFAAEFFIKETPTEQLQTIGRGSKTLIRILLTKLNTHLLLKPKVLGRLFDLLFVPYLHWNLDGYCGGAPCATHKSVVSTQGAHNGKQTQVTDCDLRKSQSNNSLSGLRKADPSIGDDHRLVNQKVDITTDGM
ncbi:hypothetical protein T265_04071 [Opisthorchis viverrini]|uniref:Calx-beta domain-containing protein n=1 Tax=Opisthorchis viverrini TaxID=6198 RepID=A0A074ZQ68_OPIVI|nr:hypothetical protein T265_04071 [Opisthorchis viverrini]KER29221.1 hypothetical protein T265_04071 [Opisthorchis viverrini]